MFYFIYEFIKTLFKQPRNIIKKSRELALQRRVDKIGKKVNIVVGSSGVDGDGYFQESINQAAPSRYYSLNAYGANNHLAQIVEYLEKATFSIDIAVYAMNSPPVNDVLLRASDNGIEVRIITEKCYLRQFSKTTIQGLLEIPMMVPPARPDRMMHHKICVIDGYRRRKELRKPDDRRKALGIAITGSFNWIAFQRSYDDIFISSNFEIVNKLEVEYIRLWEAIKSGTLV